MLEYDRMDNSERIDINKTNASKECDICHYRENAKYLQINWLKSVNISDIVNCYCANINGIWNAGNLDGIYKTFKFTLT